jgi:hypothetical protein
MDPPVHGARGRVAQLVEQGIENPRVGGSIPSPATIHINGLQRCRPFSFPKDGSVNPGLATSMPINRHQSGGM